MLIALMRNASLSQHTPLSICKPERGVVGVPLNTACERWFGLDGIAAGLTFGSWGGLAVCTKRPFELFYCVNKKYMDAVNFETLSIV